MNTISYFFSSLWYFDAVYKKGIYIYEKYYNSIKLNKFKILYVIFIFFSFN